MANAFDLGGRVAIVTGGNGGIGLGMARGLAGAGATVVIVGRNGRKNADALEALRAEGAKASSQQVDVTGEAACKAMVNTVLDDYGRLDILVNNAGINIRKAPQDYALAEWHAIIDANLTSAFICSQAAYPALKQSGRGKIINTGSMTSLFGASFAGPYGASKGGIMQLTMALAAAWAKDNIQVNCVLPGWVDTDLTRQARKDVQGLHERVLARTPAGRWGDPADFGGIAAFLASSASDFITGTAIPVDGGYSAQG